MLNSFREYFNLFFEEVMAIMEMARPVFKHKEEDKPAEKRHRGPYVVYLDEYDLDFLSHLLKPGWLERAKEDSAFENAIINLWDRAIQMRYSGEMLRSKLINNKYADLTFSVKLPKEISRSFVFKDVPIHGNELLEKVRYFGWDPSNPLFEMTHGTSKQKAKRMWEIYKEGNVPPVRNDSIEEAIKRAIEKDFPYYGPPPAANPKLSTREREEKSEKTGKWRVEAEGPISRQPIYLDKEDLEYIESFKEEYIKMHSGKDVNLFTWQLAKESHDDVDTLAKQALGLRYSDYFIFRDANGDFRIRGEFADDNGKPLDRGEVLVKMYNKMVTVPNVKLNLDHLLEKFKDQFKNHYRDFTGRDSFWVDYSKLDVSKKEKNSLWAQQNTRLTRWLTNLVYNPYFGTSGEEVLTNINVINQLSDGHEAWRRGELEKSPVNFEDVKLNYDPKDKSFEEILQDDAKVGAKYASYWLKRFFDGIDETKIAIHINDATQEAYNHLRSNKSGHPLFPSTKQRRTWAQAVALKYLKQALLTRTSLDSPIGDDDKGATAASMVRDRSSSGTTSLSRLEDMAERIFADPKETKQIIDGIEKILVNGVWYSEKELFDYLVNQAREHGYLDDDE